MTTAAPPRWRCTECSSTPSGPVQPSLAPGYGFGYCYRCNRHSAYRAEDQERGEALKRAGQARVLDHGPTYAERFNTALWAISRRPGPFTSEDVTAEVGLPPEGTHPSVVGALMTAAAKRGWIRKTGRRVKARRTNQHAAELTEWEGI